MSDFIAAVEPQSSFTPFHAVYFRLLDEFAHGRIRRLIVSVPPQHGKSFGASQVLPAYMLGVDPSLRIAIASYSFGLARRMGLAVGRMIGSGEYRRIFPGTILKGMGADASSEKTARRTAQEFDCVGRSGGLLAVGREGSLTGNRVDVMIMDDLYKDALEANSPLVRSNVWEWYNAVVRTRLHNDSQELIVFTRWHEEDLIGRIQRSETVVRLTDFDQLPLIGADGWVAVNFEALKESAPTALDPRGVGQALWPERHSCELLLRKRRSDPVIFEAMYQGNPTSREGLLYRDFATYDTMPLGARLGNYTDTADVGDDYLCSVCYGVGRDQRIYLYDVVYSQDPMETTEMLVSEMLRRAQVRSALFESNNGGRGFARAVQRAVPGCTIRMFHQGANKESRILTNAATVLSRVVMPMGWKERWPEFASDLLGFRRMFRANKHDDVADTITGIVETESGTAGGKVGYIGFASR